MKIISVESISEAVKNRRKQMGLTQSETAAMCNVGARFFSELENGKETLQMNKVLHCLEMLGINLYAVNREDDKWNWTSMILKCNPEKVTDKGAVKSMRKFLDNAGVKNDDL